MTSKVAKIDSRSATQAHQILYSWGANSYGQLAQGHEEDKPLPREATPIAHIILSLTGGGGHTLIIAEDGQLLSCGSNNYGQLGQSEFKDSAVLRPVAGLGHLRISMVTGGWDFTLALTDSGVVYSWGSNAFGQLGRPEVKKCTCEPSEVTFSPHARICHIVGGMRHALAVTETGSLFSWGWGKKGQLGVMDNGKPVPSSSLPMSVPLADGAMKVKMGFAGSYHSGAVTDCGRVLVWGLNKWGQTTQKNPQETPQVPTPYVVPLELFGGERIEKVASGWSHCLALTASGRLVSWGRSDFGQLGREAVHPFDPTPSTVELSGVPCSVLCGSEHCIVLTGEGRVQTWGWNEHGMCGTGNVTDVHRPQTLQALADQTVSLIGTGAGHVLAVMESTRETGTGEIS